MTNTTQQQSTSQASSKKVPICIEKNHHHLYQKQKTSSKKRPSSIEAAKKRLSKNDRKYLESFLRCKKTCLCIDGTVTTVAFRSIRVCDEDNLLYITVVDIDARAMEWELTAPQLIEAIHEATALDYYVIERYLEYKHDEKKDTHSVKVVWSTGQKTWEPLEQLKKDDPVGLANWARSDGLDGNVHFDWIAKVLDDAGEDSIYLGIEYEEHRCYVKVRTSTSPDGAIESKLESLSTVMRRDSIGLARWARKVGFEADPKFQWITKVLEENVNVGDKVKTVPLKRKAPVADLPRIDPTRRSSRLLNRDDTSSTGLTSNDDIKGKILSMVNAAQTTIDNAQEMKSLVEEASLMLNGAKVSVKDEVCLGIGTIHATIASIEEVVITMKQAVGAFEKYQAESGEYANGMCAEEAIGHIQAVSQRGTIVINNDEIQGAVDRLKDGGRKISINGLYDQLDGSLSCNQTPLCQMVSPTIEKRATLNMGKLEGKRVRRHFECGKTSCGTIISRLFDDDKESASPRQMNRFGDLFTVVYEDGDREDMDVDEVVEHFHDPMPIEHNPCLGRKLHMIEVFAGSSMVTQEFRKVGWSGISIDANENSNAQCIQKVQDLDLDSFKAPDFVHFAPPCTTYSIAAGSYHRGNAKEGDFNRSGSSYESDVVLIHVERIMTWARNRCPHVRFVVENPSSGCLKDMPLMKKLVEAFGLKPVNIFYCAFGRDEMKPTTIWTNDENLAAILSERRTQCRHSNHSAQVQGDSSKYDFCATPIMLAREIARYINLSMLLERRQYSSMHAEI